MGVFAGGFMMFDGWEILWLGNMNYIVCSWMECSDPFPLFFFPSIFFLMSYVFQTDVGLSHVCVHVTAPFFSLPMSVFLQNSMVCYRKWRKCFLLFSLHFNKTKQPHVALAIFILASNQIVQLEFFEGSSTIGRQKGQQILTLTVKIWKRCMKLSFHSENDTKSWCELLITEVLWLGFPSLCFCFYSLLTLMPVWMLENVTLCNVFLGDVCLSNPVLKRSSRRNIGRNFTS